MARSVCPAGRRPRGCAGRHVWNGGCLLKRSGGWAGWGLWLGARVAGLGVWDRHRNRGGVQSWPGRTWGGKKTQLGPRPPAHTLWCLYRALAT